MRSQKPNNIQKLSLLMLLLLLLAPLDGRAQLSGARTFSPYTMYGLGDMAIGGSAFNRSMGGVGIAYRNPYVFNYLNPAALSAMPQRSALFNFAGEGQNIYSRTSETSTSYNSFNIHDLGLAVPLARGVGLGFSLTPISSVGYATQIIDDSPDITNNIGSTFYSYSGDGGITQVSASVGVAVVKGLSLGASLHYWFGMLDRQYSVQLNPYLNPTDNYRAVLSAQAMHLSKILYSFGAQYTFRVKENNGLTIGLTYQPRVTANMRTNSETITTNGSSMDTVFMGRADQSLKIADKISAGIFYQTEKLGIGFDYNRQNWKGAFEIPSDQKVSLRSQEEYKIGLSYTPSRYDVRRAMKRWTYKVGARYGTSYLMYDNHIMHDVAVTLGADVPLRKFSPSKLGFGAEVGMRGTTASGQIQETYFKIFVGFSFFADDWFVKHRYN